MRYLTKSEIRDINGGSETIKRIGAWLKGTWCKLTCFESDSQYNYDYCGQGNNVRC